MLINFPLFIETKYRKNLNGAFVHNIILFVKGLAIAVKELYGL